MSQFKEYKVIAPFIKISKGEKLRLNPDQIRRRAFKLNVINSEAGECEALETLMFKNAEIIYLASELEKGKELELELLSGQPKMTEAPQVEEAPKVDIPNKKKSLGKSPFRK